MPRSRVRGPYKVPRHSVTQPSDPSYSLIPLTQGQNAIVDTEDYLWLSDWNWFAQWCETSNSFYARRNLPGGGHISMHREILCCSAEEEGDHWNHDTLDNRRANLRKCSRIENNRNNRRRKDSTSGFKGVHKMQWASRKTGEITVVWTAGIRVNKEQIHLGSFYTPEEAAKAYDNEAKKRFGEFAVLNFPVTSLEPPTITQG